MFKTKITIRRFNTRRHDIIKVRSQNIVYASAKGSLQISPPTCVDPEPVAIPYTMVLSGPV